MSTEKRDYYEVLGVPKDASKEQIKTSYRKLAMQYHPDRNKAPGAEERFKEISEAYAVLSDDAKRAQYDRFGHEGIQGRYTPEDIFRTANFEEILRDLGFGGFGGFSGSIFDMFFGNMTGSGRGSRRGADLRYDLDLTLEQVASGLTTEIEIPRTERCAACKGTGARPGSSPRVCTECGGRGQVQKINSAGFAQFVRIETCRLCRGKGEILDNPCRECKGRGTVQRTRKMSVKVPAGIDDGASLRLRGEGDAGESGSTAGDLYVLCHILPHKFFTRQESDLVCKVPLDAISAALGTTIRVPTIEGGTVEVAVPAGTQNGTVLKLKGKGMPSLGGGSRGNLLVAIAATIPTKLSEKQKELLRQYKELDDEKKSGFLHF
ncbi:MAG: molecular chaperone DnaJ [Thaumarchaeota archaeon]|nr:molecular chaperone DnaJ [Nitrososphaerota archaeon]MCL5067703.1 molecular chaperone DnaJ [Nitrososphaerota archaeon]MDG6906579.1 molecular chaperone DnaJ [Nitrososphaerota archaeon]